MVLLQSIQSCPVKPSNKTTTISLAGIAELKETKELGTTSEALENRLNNYSVVKEVGIIHISVYAVAITFII